LDFVHIFHQLHRNPALPSPVARVGRIAKCLNRFQVRRLDFNRRLIWGVFPLASTKTIEAAGSDTGRGPGKMTVMVGFSARGGGEDRARRQNVPTLDRPRHIIREHAPAPAGGAP
jgi:hypothetical protein